MLEPQYTPAEAAKIARRHVVTIRRDLVGGTLHGSQRVDGGRWLISEGCLSAYMAGAECQHRAASNVTPMRRAG
ncbi:hypothetical protein [Microbacterium sp. SL75]|uniref:hypothetical protein n=1 Tax=Microbacterium sp. SL75 TaxID=2995140 RepID=UPI00226D875C|nr:hypothetical protein [Microbacterium sp. SL75]WAC68869.1 hypothetical protein OVA17_14975 [Microbacterium sp. SL75]